MGYQDMNLSPLAQSVRVPLPGDRPAGTDPAYDDDFLRIKAEIDRLGTVAGKVDQEKVMQDAREMENIRTMRDAKERAAAMEAMRQRSSLAESSGPEFRLVIELATKLLTTKSKDLRVAAYLCLALWRAEHAAGMVQGLTVILLLVAEYWDTMFPAAGRTAARKGALDFLFQRLTEEIKGSEVTGADRACLEEAQKVVASLELELTTRMAENAPSMLALGKAVDGAIARLPKPAAPGAQPGLAAGRAGQTTVSPASAEGEPRSLQDAVDLIRKASSYLRGQDHKSVVPYRLMRSMRWDALVNEPPNEGGRTKIEPPPAVRRSYLAGLRQQGQWEKLLEEGEATFAQPPFHFWFDLQQLLVAALEGLGADYGPVRAAILQDVATLQTRLPKVSSLQFNDGTPFASPAARAWIDEVALPVLGGSGPAPSGPLSGGDARLKAAFEEARKLVDRGDLATAIAALQGLALFPRSRRAEFERRLDIALLCMRASQLTMACPILEALNEELDRCALAEWDPALAVETWKALERCYRSLAGSGPGAGRQALADQANRIFEKICRTDVQVALAMAGAPPKEGSVQAPAPKPVPAGVPAEGGEHGRAAAHQEPATRSDS